MLVIATGTPIVPSFGEFNPSTYTLTSMEDGLAVKEALKDSKNNAFALSAAALSALKCSMQRILGKHVTIIEREQHVMSRQLALK